MNVKSKVEVILTLHFKNPGYYNDFLKTIDKIKGIIREDGWLLDEWMREEVKENV